MYCTDINTLAEHYIATHYASRVSHPLSHPLFNHTCKPQAKDARPLDPTVPRTRKWEGMAKGWEGAP